MSRIKFHGLQPTSPAPQCTLRTRVDESTRGSVLRRRAQREWFNAGYIFPEGFASRVQFRSSVALGATCAHECAVVGPGGAFWPAPTFTVTAADQPLEPLVAKSCTGCWSAVSSCKVECCG